eukprot:TRINITY_DN3433_c0_g1_i1.p1 TRINITY_DN3433_c0_g1~~TRINITY_DN3433_c0_g1_i1.p1  ORF type:complete len:336 (-),score=111.72 TRINITY_DN3433_c0_g1_i1:38-1045(-)
MHSSVEHQQPADVPLPHNPASSPLVIKEGHLLKRAGTKSSIIKQWSQKYFILVSGSLYYYSSQSDENHKGVIHLKDCKASQTDLSESQGQPLTKSPKTGSGTSSRIKKKSILISDPKGREILLRAESEDLLSDWFASIESNLDKSETSSPPLRPKSKGLKYKTEKMVMEKAAMSSVGKSALKEYVPDDTWIVLKICKRIVANLSGKARAKEIENTIMKIGVDVAMLTRKGFLKSDETMETCQFPLLKVWESVIHSICPKRRNVPALVVSINELMHSFETLLSPHLTSKHMVELRDTMMYFNEENINAMFADERNQADWEMLSPKLKDLKSAFLFG